MDCSHDKKMLAPWKKSYDKPRQRIKKQRHHFANKGPYSHTQLLSSVQLFATSWSPPGSSVHGILQARTLECVAITGPITTWQIDGETVETVKDFILGGSKITADGDCSHKIKRCLLLGRKVMTNLDSIFKSRDITLSTKVL